VSLFISSTLKEAVIPVIKFLISASGCILSTRTFEMLPVGGLAAGVNMSLFSRLMFGISYSATDIVSYSRPVFSKYPGFLIKFMMVDEEDYVPQISMGISSQGFGEYVSSRYVIKSKGFFLNASKIIYPPYGELLFGGGINYSVFENTGEKFPDIFCQTEYFLGDEFGFLLEYTLGLDDRLIDGAFGKGWGYLNAGLRWVYVDNLAIDLNFIDLLKNNEEGRSAGRSVKITYTERF